MPRTFAVSLADVWLYWHALTFSYACDDDDIMYVLDRCVEYECFTPFLNTMQYLLVIPSLDAFGKTLWESVESTVGKIVTRVDDDVSLSLDSLKQLLEWKDRKCVV